MPPTMTTPDVRQLQEDRLPAAEFPGGREQAFRIFIEPATHSQIWQHAQADTSVEICGVLVGTWGRDALGPFVNVAASIRGDAAANKFAEVTFTHETWSKINAELDSKHADQSIVGWYHTHPDFGIFLSERDRFIQENFFSGAGQIAHVVDPIRNLEGIFAWGEGKPVIAPHFWVGNRLVTSASEPKEIRSYDEAGKHAASDRPAAAAASADSAKISEWMAISGKVLQYLLVFLLGCLLAGQLKEFALSRARQEGMAVGLYQYGLRPQLELRLSEINADLKSVGTNVQTLAAHHQQLMKQVEMPPEQLELAQRGWNDVEQRLNRADKMLQAVENEYCLTDSERDLLNRLWQAKEAAAKRGLERSKPAESSKPPEKTGVKPKPAEKPAAPVKSDSTSRPSPEAAKSPAN